MPAARRRDGRARGLDRLLTVVATLRGEHGCPWDREQTLHSLKRYVIEESYELVDAVESGDPARHLDELGDVLLQVVLQAQIRSEEGRFKFDDVAGALADKLIRRHPHVYGAARARDSAAVVKNWEIIKAGEKKSGPRSVVEGIPRHLPALQRAQRIQSRVARVGFDWKRVDAVLEKVEEEIGELRAALKRKNASLVREEIGDLLFTIVNFCRFRGIEAEEALEQTINKFLARFRHVEARVFAAGRKLTDCTLEELDGYWNDAKRKLRGKAGRQSRHGCRRARSSGARPLPQPFTMRRVGGARPAHR